MPLLHSTTWQQLHRLLVHLPPGLRRRFLLLLPVSVIPGLLDAAAITVVAWMMASLVGSRIRPGIPNLPDLSWVQSAPALVLIGTFIALSWLRSISMVFALGLQERTLGQLWLWFTETLYGHLLSRPYELHLRDNDKKLAVQVLANTSLVVKGAFAPFIKAHAALASICLLLVGLIVVGGWLSVVLFLSLGVLYATFSILLTSRLRSISVQKLRLKKVMKQIFLDSFHLLREIRLAGAESYFQDRFRVSSARAKRAESLSHFLPLLPRQVIEPLGISLIFGLGALSALFGRGDQASLDTVLPWLATLALASQRMTPAVNELFMALTRLRASAPNLNSLLSSLEPSTPFHGDPIEESLLLPSSGIDSHDCVRLHDVTYAYPGRDQPVLSGLSLSIPAGSCVGLVGASGSGKSTLAHLLLGLLTPQQGCLEVGGRVVDGTTVRSWQAHCAYVPQLPRFLRGNIIENVAFAEDPQHVDLDRVWQALDKAQLGHAVANLPDGLHTSIGLDASLLSGGQRQRLALARAFYRRASFVLLDEPTGALDDATERTIMNAVMNEASACTMVIISHRQAPIERCERVYVLSAGRIQLADTMVS